MLTVRLLMLKQILIIRTTKEKSDDWLQMCRRAEEMLAKSLIMKCYLPALILKNKEEVQTRVEFIKLAKFVV